VFLTHLPRLIDGHTPTLTGLPDFLASLALCVDYLQEKPCFHGVAVALACFYALPPPLATTGGTGLDVHEGADGSGSGGIGSAPERAGPGSVGWLVEHVLFPAFRTALSLAPPRRLGAGNYVVQLACTEQLYRIFERC